MGDLLVYLATIGNNSLFILLGVSLIVLAIVGKIQSKIELTNLQKIGVFTIGVFLILLGILPFFISANETVTYSTEEAPVELINSPTIMPSATTQISTIQETLILSPTDSYECISGDFAPMDNVSFYPFSIELKENQYVHGQCTSFNGYDLKINGGVAYIIKGPGKFEWSTIHGWWDVCSNGNINDLENSLDTQAESLEQNNNTATGKARKVECELINGIPFCSEK